MDSCSKRTDNNIYLDYKFKQRLERSTNHTLTQAFYEI